MAKEDSCPRDETIPAGHHPNVSCSRGNYYYYHYYCCHYYYFYMLLLLLLLLLFIITLKRHFCCDCLIAIENGSGNFKGHLKH